MNCNLTVYCTTSGELPRLVSKRSPMCFVPYSEAIALQQRLTSLERAVELLLEGGVDLYNVYLDKYCDQK